LKVAAITSIQVRPGKQLEICVERTNDTWQLTSRLTILRTLRVSRVVARLGKPLRPVQITARIKKPPDAEKEFGFDAQSSRWLSARETTAIKYSSEQHPPQGPGLLTGGRNVGVFLVDAELLKLIPVKRTTGATRC